MAALTVLEIVQQMCVRTGIPVPSLVVSNSEEGVRQYFRLLQEVAAETMRRFHWQFSEIRITWTSVAAESQGTLDSLFGVSMDVIENMTLWNNTQRRPIFGPLTDRDYQLVKDLVGIGPPDEYKIMGNQLLINPVMPGGESCSALIRSKNWLLDADTVTTKRYITADSDVSLLDDELMILGLRAKWKMEKGFAYAEDMRSFEMMAKTLSGRDGTKKSLHLDYGPTDIRPGIFVPAGSWPLSGGA